MIHPGDFWNQPELGTGTQFERGLLSLFTVEGNGKPRPIGTAFLISADGGTGVACTAAHNFSGIAQLQQPPLTHHSSALREFLPEGKPLNLAASAVRAMLTEIDRVEMAQLTWAVWDERNDIAVFGLRPQIETDMDCFKSAYEVTDTVPHVGELIAISGFSTIDVDAEFIEPKPHAIFRLIRTHILRIGRVKAIFPEGHLLCRGPCIETSIPVFPGMSGAPAMRFGSAGEPMVPFGVVSSDADQIGIDKNDRTAEGTSIVALLGAKTTVEYVSGKRTMQFSFGHAHFVQG